jgi:hypothetical protein
MLTSCCVKGGEVVLDYGDFVVLFPVPVLPDGQRLLSSLPSFGVSMLSKQQGADDGKVACRAVGGGSFA